MELVEDIHPDVYQYYELQLQDGTVLGRVGDSYPYSGDPIDPSHLQISMGTMIAENDLEAHESVRVIHENGTVCLDYEECEILR